MDDSPPGIPGPRGTDTPKCDTVSMDLLFVGRFEWESVIRRIVVPPRRRAVKVVAMMAATYATTRDGSSIRPGEARLAAVCQLGPSTVRESLRWLREQGLLHRVSRGSNLGRANWVDVYRLSLPVEWDSSFTLLNYDGRDEFGLVPRPRRRNANTKATTDPASSR